MSNETQELEHKELLAPRVVMGHRAAQIASGVCYADQYTLWILAKGNYVNKDVLHQTTKGVVDIDATLTQWEGNGALQKVTFLSKEVHDHLCKYGGVLPAWFVFPADKSFILSPKRLVVEPLPESEQDGELQLVKALHWIDYVSIPVPAAMQCMLHQLSGWAGKEEQLEEQSIEDQIADAAMDVSMVPRKQPVAELDELTLRLSELVSDLVESIEPMSAVLERIKVFKKSL